jgi:hypothetical protein
VANVLEAVLKVEPNLDHWLPDAALQIRHRRESSASPEELWEAARTVRVRDTALLGRLVRWRIPGTPANQKFDELFRSPPFLVLEEQDELLVSGLVGRIWTLRRDYPALDDPEEFREWSARGTARVVFANWVQRDGDDRAALCSEARVEPIGTQGRLGLAAVRPLIGRFHGLVGSNGIQAAVKLAERR